MESEPTRVARYSRPVVIPRGHALIVLHILSSKKKSAFSGPRSKRVPRQGQIIESLQSNP